MSPQHLLSLAVLLVAWLLLRRLPAPGPSASVAAARWLPLIAAVLTCALTAWIWGGVRAPAIWHDESAYLLQAELLAYGRFSVASPPMPEAFTQAAVLVEPRLAPKMLPGHAAVLAPGVRIGLPGLIPVLLAGATAALLVVLVRDWLGGPTAVAAWLLWSVQAGQQRWRASYMSETTTTAGWLLGWWLLQRWRTTRSPRILAALGALSAGLAVTRPLAALAFAVPAGLVILHDLSRTGGWRALAPATASGLLVLSVVAWQNDAVLGTWTRTPVGEYTRQYIPFDRLGFGLDATPGTRRLPPDLAQAFGPLVALHAAHTPARLPEILVERLRPIAAAMFGGWRIIFLACALLAAFALPRPLWLPLASSALHVALYLGYAHDPTWTAYYVEVMPVLAVLSAVGLVRALDRIFPRTAGSVGAVLLLGAAMVPLAAHDHGWTRRILAAMQAPYREFDARVAALGPAPLLVMVVSDPAGDPHRSFVRNVARPDRAPVLTAHFLNDREATRLAARFPDRRAYRYDQRTGVLTPWERP